MADAEQIHSLAQALIASIKKMSPREKADFPTVHFGDRYNEMLSMAKECAPDVNERCWPKPVQKNPDFGTVHVRYSELEVYCRQIVELLPRSVPVVR